MPEDGIGYLQVRSVAAGLADEVATICQAMDTTNKLKGIVLDLRFAEGDDYAAAVTVANLFVADEQELLDWGSGDEIRREDERLHLAGGGVDQQ